MKNLIFTLALAMNVVASAGANQTTQFKSSQDYFSINFEGVVEQEKLTTRWGSGQITSTIYLSKVDTRYYQVMVTPLPREILRTRTVQDLLDAARDGTKTTEKSSIDAEQKLLVNGAAARRFITTTPNSPKIVHLVVVANGRIYHASATVLADDLKRGVDFVKSFTLNAVINSSSS